MCVRERVCMYLSLVHSFMRETLERERERVSMCERERDLGERVSEYVCERERETLEREKCSAICIPYINTSIIISYK